MMEIPVTGPSYVFEDNKSVLPNTRVPDLVLRKKSNSIAYNFVREGAAWLKIFFVFLVWIFEILWCKYCRCEVCMLGVDWHLIIKANLCSSTILCTHYHSRIWEHWGSYYGHILKTWQIKTDRVKASE